MLYATATAFFIYSSPVDFLGLFIYAMTWLIVFP